MRALVVDDEIVALKALTRRIQWEKYGVDQVFTARSMQQAQQVLKNEEIDFMLCDIEMPNGTGLDLAEWMRQHYPVSYTHLWQTLTCRAMKRQIPSVYKKCICFRCC